MLHRHRYALLLFLVLLLALCLRLVNLAAIGDGNTYYAAAVKSMLLSPHNLFFNAAEPGGSVTVDKPPLGLWIQAASAAIFGVNGVALALPQVVAGTLAVWLLHRLVRRQAGEIAGLIAALALAIAPVSVTADRSNLLESALILALLLAAWAFLLAAEKSSLRHLLLGSLLVGLGFNIKMLAAFLPLPAFFLLYLLAARHGWLKKLLHLLLAGAVLLAVSLSWALAVDLTPPENRPYVGGSQENSVLELALGYNGLTRLLGVTRGAAPATPGGQSLPPPPRASAPPQPTGNPPGDSPSQPAAPPAFQNEVGAPGALRLFTMPLAREAGWLLPLSLLGLALLVVSQRPRLPLSPAHRMVVLWGGWLLTAGIFFSVAGFFHAYYLALLAPPASALLGAGAWRAWELIRHRPANGSALLALVGSLMILYQFTIVQPYTEDLWFLFLALGLAILGISLGFAAPRRAWMLPAGALLVLGTALITPLVWSLLGVIHTIPNQMVPGSYNGTTFPGDRRNGTAMAGVNRQLLDYLQQNTRDVEYLMAVPSANDGSRYILASGRPVLLMGGFGGSDPVVSTADLAQMVAGRRLRFVWDTGSLRASKPDIHRWLHANCRVVEEVNLLPPFQPPAPRNPLLPRPGGIDPPLPQPALYRCGE